MDPFGEVPAGPRYGGGTILMAGIDLSNTAWGKFDLGAERGMRGRWARRGRVALRNGHPDRFEESRVLMQGTVKFFDSERGFGFISREGGDDVFVHYSNIVGEVYGSLDKGHRVEFEIGPGRKGDEAKNVRRI